MTLGLAALGMLMASCGNYEPVGTHQMGPPGKSRPMADSVMPSRAR